MRSVAALATSSLLASAAHAQVVAWDITKRDVGSTTEGLQKRSTTYQEVITNEKSRGGYFATVAVGTPSQNLTLQLDTGSSDIWLPYSGASICSTSTRSSSSASSTGCTLGSCEYSTNLHFCHPNLHQLTLLSHTVDYKASSTFSDVGPGLFSIAYVDGSSSKGDYFTDVFEIGGASLTNVTMGLGLKTDIAYGLVGVGYALNEAIVGASSSASSAYNNLPLQMQDEDLIATNAYSLWLNDLDASTGSILFGGIDTEKYEGDLTRINVQKDENSGVFSSFIVLLTSLTANSTSGSDSLSSREFPIPVVLDSGTTLSYLPTDIASQIWNEVGAVYSSDVQAAVLPCSMENSVGTFSFGFGGSSGPKISVGMDELVLPLVSSGDNLKFTSGKYSGQDACQFGIQNFSSDPFLLGDTFLRSAYVVYDLVNNQIGIAKTDFNSTTSNIVAFASDGAQIPSATTAANQATATAATGTLTTPAYAASAGFLSSASTKSAAISTVPRFEWAQLGVTGASVLFMMVGSGFFLL